MNLINLNIKVELEGTSQSNSYPSVPFSSPYDSSAPYYNTTVCSLIVSNPVDWVLVKLRKNANDPNSTVFIRPGMLDSNGYVHFCTLDNDELDLDLSLEYFVTVQHRNHLGVMSHNKLSFINGTLTYDFTTQDSHRSSPFVVGQKEKSPNKWVMIAGNVDKNNYKAINSADFTLINSEMGKTGYVNSDFNIDGVVDQEDARLFNLNQGKRSGINF